MRYLIGISGFRRCGKDSFARALRDVTLSRGLAFVTVAYADALREAAAAAYGVDSAAFTDDARKDTVCPEWDITYRQMLINLGEAMCGVDADHWVKTWRRQANGRVLVDYLDSEQRQSQAWVRLSRAELYTQDIVVAVPDVRRLNEAAAVHDAGGVNVLVRRPGIEWNGHVTEALSWVGSVVARAQRPLRYLSQAFDDHKHQAGQELRIGSWYPERLATQPGMPNDRIVFDAVVDNDADVAALRPHAERVLDMVTKGKR